MNRAPTIVCPVDYSDHSRRALQYAAFLMGHFDARLVILHVLDPLLLTASRLYQTDLLDDETNELRTFFKASVASHMAGMPDVMFLAVTGEADTEILRVAHQEEADVIVLGTHGLSGYQKLIFGSTTERVLRHADVPVLAVPLRKGEPLLPDDERRFTLSPILAPVDFSDSSVQAARVAAGLAASVGARLVLAHVLRPVHAVGRWRAAAQDQESSNLAAAGSRMARLVQSLDLPAPPETELRTGNAAEVIGEIAEARQVRLIVMGLRGAGGLLGPAPGSVTYRVLCLAAVPVLALPASATVRLFGHHTAQAVDAEC